MKKQILLALMMLTQVLSLLGQEVESMCQNFRVPTDEERICHTNAPLYKGNEELTQSCMMGKVELIVWSKCHGQSVKLQK